MSGRRTQPGELEGARAGNGRRRHAAEAAPERREASYGRDWSADRYLAQYYSGNALPLDEARNAEFLGRHLQRLGRRYTLALELGCGPTIHHAACLAPHVDELHLCDYLPENLAQVRLWLEKAPGAHDWSPFLSKMLEIEGLSRPGALAEREALLRRVVTRLATADLRKPEPLGEPARYDLVASYYCVEAISADPSAWAASMENLAGLVAPGGVLVLGAARKADGYFVFERRFPFARIDEHDVAAVLERVGFPRSDQRIEVARDIGWEAEGFNSIVCACAVRDGPCEDHRRAQFM